MENVEILNGLAQLGFNNGFAVSEQKIILWEHEEDQPTAKEIADASKLWAASELAKAKAKEAERAALLTRLGMTAEEAALLIS